MASPLTHRKLLLLNSTTSNSTTNPTIQTCLYHCNLQKTLQKNTTSPNLFGFCPMVCLPICPSLCHYTLSNDPSLPNFSPSKPNKPHPISPPLITMLILLSTTFLLITFYIFYTKLYFHYYSPNTNSLSRPRFSTRSRRTHEDNHSLGEEHGNRMVFHPFWQISTIGLTSMEIQRLPIKKYVEENIENQKDCAVCLAEFEEGESLRILPKCSHAFHIPCIDTWLTSHITCPICRAHVRSHDHHDRDRDRVVEITSSSNHVISRELVIIEDNSLDRDARVNNGTSILDEGENNNLENLRGINCNKISFSQRWSFDRGRFDLLSRSLSCSGKIFSSSCSRN
ncbi:unnamed protein product [Amaranthus hypochondriacus]